MAGSAPDELIRAHIQTIARREQDDYTVLADSLHGLSWPDGGLDRRHPEATTWFRRFATLAPANRPTPIPRACGCSLGRCLVCN